MLSRRDKQRIHSEEIYRNEIRQQLDKKEKPSAKTKLWTFLNSTFGLWLLSTVAVGFITWSYTEWTKNKTEKSGKAELIRKLDSEITGRISFLEASLNKNDIVLGVFFDSLYKFFNRNKDSNEDTVFEEFNNRNMRSLLIELSQIVPESEKPEIYKAIEGVDKIVPYRTPIAKDNEKGDQPLSPDRRIELENVKRIIAQHFKISRWETTKSK